MSDPENRAPLFVGLARAPFRLGMAAPIPSSARKRSSEGRALSPRGGATRLFIMNGMTRAAAQELGGRKSLAVMEAVFSQTRTEEAFQGMRAATTRACTVLGVMSCVQDLDRDVCPDSDEVLRPDRGAQARAWFHRFCSLRENLVPMVVLPIRDNFWSLMGRRVRVLNSSDSRRRVRFGLGADFRAALKASRSSEPQSAVQVRGRAAAVGAGVGKRHRHMWPRLRTFVCGYVEGDP